MVSLQLFLNVGTLIAAAMNKAYSTYTTSEGWKTVTGLQFIFPVRKFVRRPAGPIRSMAADLNLSQSSSCSPYSFPARLDGCFLKIAQTMLSPLSANSDLSKTMRPASARQRSKPSETP